MPYEIKLVNSLQKEKLEKYLGTYNSIPPMFEEISLEGLSKKGYLNFIPEFIYYKQLYGDGLYKYNLKNYDVIIMYINKGGYGYAVFNNWVTNKVRFFTFDCIEKIKKDFYNLSFISDSGWMMDDLSSKPDYGIRHYNRKIDFGRKLDNNDFDLVRLYLERDNCPGWTGICGFDTGGGKYKFSTSYDSSD